MRLKIDRDLDTMHYLWEEIAAWIRKHEITCSEDIMQSDAPQLEAPLLLSRIVEDIMKPEWEE